jgi:hypothetical protein
MVTSSTRLREAGLRLCQRIGSVPQHGEADLNPPALLLTLWLPALRIAVTPSAEAKQVSVRRRVSANLKLRLVVPES